MRSTNFKVGQMQNGFESSYNSQFYKEVTAPMNTIFIDKRMRNNLEKSHWDHSRSWRQNFKSEATHTWKPKSDRKNFEMNKTFGY